MNWTWLKLCFLCRPQECTSFRPCTHYIVYSMTRFCVMWLGANLQYSMVLFTFVGKIIIATNKCSNFMYCSCNGVLNVHLLQWQQRLPVSFKSSPAFSKKMYLFFFQLFFWLGLIIETLIWSLPNVIRGYLQDFSQLDYSSFFFFFFFLILHKSLFIFLVHHAPSVQLQFNIL
jgi:hypothetical protein